jgi:hypothetical protein
MMFRVVFWDILPCNNSEHQIGYRFTRIMKNIQIIYDFARRSPSAASHSEISTVLLVTLSSCRQDVSHPLVSNGEYGYQVRKVSTNMLNKKSRVGSEESAIGHLGVRLIMFYRKLLFSF